MTERWIATTEFPCYEVSDLGRVRRGDKILTGQKMATFRYVKLYLHGWAHTRAVHGLVLEAFAGPRPLLQVAMHRDGDDNSLANLYWATDAQQAAARSCKRPNPAIQLTAEQVLEIKAATGYFWGERDFALKFGCSRAAVRKARHYIP